MNESAAMGMGLSFLGILENGESPALQFIGRWAYKIYHEREVVEEYLMYLHLLLAAVFPIFIASHSSLRQPPSAAAPLKDGTEDEDDEINVEPMMEGLTPSDAILFPVTAGILLGGLYFFIKWMGDAKLLNKIMTIYFSTLGIFGIAKLLKDGLDLVTTFVFPHAWSNGKDTFFVSSEVSRQLKGRLSKAKISISDEIVVDKPNPFPGYLSTVRFPPAITKTLWSIRASFKQNWLLRGYIHGILNVKWTVQLNDAIGFVLGLAAVIFYNTNGKTWWVTNLMAFGFSYGSIQMISPTTFSTGSLVLAGLFVYDVVMVFYTPMMATVATSLDVPIKLVFPGPKHSSILGLGDVVLPGMMLALALRFDLYLHYLRKQRKTTFSSPDGVKEIIHKEPYLNPKGLWGDRFWTRTANRANLTTTDGARFPKVYFKASLFGYVIGMIVTLYVCAVFQHGQPALLYLVPGVLLALWGTAYFRDELKLMWEYTEDGKWGWDNENQESNKSNQSEKSNDGSTGSSESSKNGSGSSYFGPSIASQMEAKKNALKDKEKKEQTEHAHHVFLFSLSEPKHEILKTKDS